MEPAVMMIEVGLTRQPEPYQSVRVGVNMPVFIYPGIDVQGLLAEHIRQAVETIRAQIDDEFEQGHGKPASYSTERRFVLLVAREAGVIVVVPEDQEDEVPEAWIRECRKEYRGHRLAYILQQSRREYRSMTLVDCSDGDWSKLPPLEPMTVWKYRPNDESKEGKFWVIVQRRSDFNRKDYEGWWNYDEHFRENGSVFWAEMIETASKAGAALFDCTDGAFDILPQPVKREEPEEIPFEGDDEENYDDNDDRDED